MGLSIDGDEDDEDRDGGGDLGGGGGSISGTSFHPAPTPSPEILLAFGSAHGAAAFSLHGGSSSGHGAGGLGVSRHRWSAGRDPSRRGGGGGGGGGGSGMAGGLPRRVSWPGGMSTSDVGLEGTGRGGDEEEVQDMEAGLAGGSIEVGPDKGRRSTCFICCERVADAVVMECGHGGMCSICAEHLAVTPPSQCPVCRKPIREVLTIGGIVTVDSGGSLAAIAGGEELQTPEERRPSSTRIGGLGSSSSSAAAAVAAAGAAALSRPAGSSSNLQAAAARVSAVGSGTFRRFAGPDVVGASASVAGVSGDGGELGTPAQRETPSPARRESSRLDLEAQGMWLDPV